MATVSSFQCLTPSSTQFYSKVTFNFLSKSYKPILIGRNVRLDHPAIGRLFAAKENAVMKKFQDEEPTYSSDDLTKAIRDSPKTIIKDGGQASGSEVKARSQSVHMSVFKVQRVIDQIRGLSYEKALMILELMPYRACFPVLKLVYSAAANARHNMGWNEADLFVSKVEVNGGATMKRSRARARGRSFPIKKPTCHITVVLKDKSKLP